MKKILRNLIIVVALAAMTATGVWAAITTANLSFGGRVKFDFYVAGVNVAANVNYAGAEVDSYTYIADSSDPAEKVTSWDIPTITFNKSNLTATYTFVFTNTNDTDSALVTITPNAQSIVGSAFTITGGLDGAAENTATIPATTGTPSTATFTYTVTLNSVDASVESYIQFAVAVTEASAGE